MKTKKRIILIGRTFCGKTTLAQYLNDQPLQYKKTQALEVINSMIIDTPGELLEQHYLKGAILTASTDADIVMLMQSAIEENSMFPPAFTSMFCKPVIGIVTKKDVATEEQIKQGIAHLNRAGARKVFVISSVQEEGLDELLAYINEEEE